MESCNSPRTSCWSVELPVTPPLSRLHYQRHPGTRRYLWGGSGVNGGIGGNQDGLAAKLGPLE